MSFLFFIGSANRGNSHGVGYPEGEEGLAGGWRHVDASWVRVLTLGRDNALEGLRKREVDVHVVFSAHHFQGLNGRHALWPLQRPNVAVATDAPQANHLRVSRIHNALDSLLNPRPSFSFSPLLAPFYRPSASSASHFKPPFFRRFPSHCPTRTYVFTRLVAAKLRDNDRSST